MPMTRRSDAEGMRSQGQTLEDVLASAWEDLATSSRTECPVCGGTMAAAGTVTALHAPSSGGRCGDCGSEMF